METFPWYNKHNSRKFRRGGDGKFDACDGQGFDNIAHTKEHLNRAHYEKFKCARCKVLIGPTNFEMHSQALEACSPRLEHEGDTETGFSHAFHISLKIRKKSAEENEGIERWKEIYRGLFPNEPLPSPFVGEDDAGYGNSRDIALENVSGGLDFFGSPDALVRNRLAQRVDAEVDQLFLPLAQNLLAQTPSIIRDAQEDMCEEYPQSISGSAWNNPSIRLRQPLALPTSGFASRVLPTQAALENSPVALQTKQRQQSQPMANVAQSGSFHNDLRHPPRSFDSGYGPSSDNSQPSRIIGTSQVQSRVSPDGQLLFTQSQVDSMLKNHANGAVSDLTRNIEDLRNIMLLHLPHMSSNTHQISTSQPGYFERQNSSGNMHSAENPIWNQEAPHDVHPQEPISSYSREPSEASFAMQTMSQMAASHGISCTPQGKHPSNESVENELGNFSTLFDASGE